MVEGTPFSDPAATGESGVLARLFFSSNLLGEFEPCACPDLPLGGLAQAAGRVEMLRQRPTPVLWLDAGDRLFRIDMAMTGTEEAERRLRAILLVDAGSVGGLDALGVGRLELGAGLDYLRALERRASFPLLSANLVDTAGELLFTPSVLLDAGDRKIGVTSVLPVEVSGPGYRATDPRRAAKQQVAALREAGAELVVLLSNLGMDADVRLARASGADLVLGSRSRELTTEGVRAGRAQVGQAGSRGRYLGEARWYAEGKGRGPHLVVTTEPVPSSGSQHPGVARLVAEVFERLADPVLGVPPLKVDGWDDPEFRRRQAR